MDIEKLLQSVEERLEIIDHYQSVAKLMNWDSTKHLSTSRIAKTEYNKTNSFFLEKRLELLVELEDDIKTLMDAPTTLSNLEKKSVAYVLSEIQKVKLFPPKFIQRYSEACAVSIQTFREAKAGSDYKKVLPNFKSLLEISREMADMYMSHDETLLCRYDALTDDFEPGTRTESLKQMFLPIAKPISELLLQLKDHPNKPDSSFLRGTFPIEKQMAFYRYMVQTLGFDFSRGLFENNSSLTASNNTTSVYHGNVRYTTRCSTDVIKEGLFTALHENGHGMYFQSVDKKTRTWLDAGGISRALHESQARFYEIIVGKNLSFWKHFFPIMKGILTPAFDSTDVESFWRSLHVVQPSLTRIQSDELTYIMHILIRFELGVALVNGEMEAEHLPEAWNEKMKSYLGLTPPNDTLGCLQDGHWFQGNLAYFPTYAQGTFFGAQIWDKVCLDLPEIENNFVEGDFLPLLKWLQVNIHRDGPAATMDEIALSATGTKLQSDSFLKHITKKYSRIYKL